MQFRVKFAVVVDVEEEYPEDILSEAISLIEQGIGSFEYEEA